MGQLCLRFRGFHMLILAIRLHRISMFSNSHVERNDIYFRIYSFLDNLGQCCNLSGGVYFVDSLPKTASGKTLRGVVKKRITELYKLKQKIDNCS